MASKTPETALVVHRQQAIEKPWILNDEQKTLLKNNICKGATDEELRYCLAVAERYKLDAFKRQIWFVPRWDSRADNGQGGTGAEVYVPQVGIDGLLYMAARDHGDSFDSISEPEFGPIVTVGASVKAPEWARVALFKKGSNNPTVARAYWDEYMPEIDKKTYNGKNFVYPFWRKMPRRMLSKCATALALRQAYPDMGGLYIPEEMDKMNQDMTEGGRQIVEQSSTPPTGTRAAAQAVAERIISEHKSKTAPQGEIIDVAPSPPQQQEPQKPTEFKGNIEVDMTDPNFYVVRGDLGQWDEKKWTEFCHAERRDGWWGVDPKWAHMVEQYAETEGFKVKFIKPAPPKTSSSSGTEEKPETNTSTGKAKGRNPDKPTPELAAGTIERVKENNDRTPNTVSILLKMSVSKTSYWMTAWDKKLFPFLIAAKGQQVEIFTTKNENKNTPGQFYTNVVGLKRIGVQEFDEDGKTPVIQNSTREAGQKTLYP